MCGIAALVAAAGPVDLTALRAMTDIVRHRGPDDEGFVAFGGDSLHPTAWGGADTPDAFVAPHHPYLPNSRVPERNNQLHVALGHRRLSIIDLSPAGHQPMCSPDRGVWMVYNGEVYNHVELRVELEARGHAFRSHSDTEVMLAAYSEWGIDCLHRFNGMFAFVLVDRARRRMLAARDRFGVKPLYWWTSPSGLVAFASEIKQFTVLPGWQATLNAQRCYDFLRWGACEHTDESLFTGVRQLRGGEVVEIDLDHPRPHAAISPRRWYELRARSFSGGLTDAAEAFRDLLTDAVRLRLRADVPVGSCLSGGLDSSSIVCVANGLLRAEGAAGQQRTFSAASDVARYDERRFVEAVVARTNVTAREIFPRRADLLAEVDRITWHQDEPFGSTSIYAQWQVFRLAAENGVKVMLDGQGADESLAGYHAFFGARLASLARRLRWGEVAREVEALRQYHGYPARWALREGLAAVLPRSAARILRPLVEGNARAHDWLDLRRLGAARRHPFDELEGVHRASVDSLSRAQLLRTSLPMLLHWEDRDSMAHSIEARVPFLDFRLVELALGLPEEFKIAEGVTKRVLREAMTGILPETVRIRTDKLGFQTPEEEWMRESPAEFRTALERAVAASDGIITAAAFELLDDVVAGRRPFSFLPWRLIAFGVWMERFGVRRP